MPFNGRNIPDMENWYSKIYDKKDVTDPFVGGGGVCLEDLEGSFEVPSG